MLVHDAGDMASFFFNMDVVLENIAVLKRNGEFGAKEEVEILPDHINCKV